MSRFPISRACSLSSVSSFTSVSDTSADLDNDVQPPSSQSSETKRTRKRFSHDQLIVLEQAYHKSSHPTRDEREEISKQAEMSVKSVTIWFQNKRQTERKMALNNAASRTTLLPLTMYPVHQSTPLPATTEPSTRPNPSVSHDSTALSKTKHRLPMRTASGFLSLDRIASRTERAPRTPTTPVRHVSLHESRPGSPEALWDSMLSSPIQPEPDRSSHNSPPESPSARDLLKFASTRYAKHGGRPRGRRTLEWACAAARMTVENDDKDTGLDTFLSKPPSVSFDASETPGIDDDASTEIIDTEMESIGDSHEAITPDASLNEFTYQSLPVKETSDVVGQTTLDGDETVKMALDMKNEEDKDKDKEIMDAAWALCGLSALRG